MLALGGGQHAHGGVLRAEQIGGVWMLVRTQGRS